MKLGNREVVSGDVFVIAEAGVNHLGDIDRALEMIDVAAACGVDAVKFQTFDADKLVSSHAEKARYQAEQTGGGSQLDMLRNLQLSDDDHSRLMSRCAERDVLFLSTPFEEASADVLELFGVGAFKIPSGEITNFQFLEHVARNGKPMLVSTGMSDIGEVARAVDAIEAAGNTQIVLLHCVSQYPSDPAETNLRAMQTMRQAFGYPVGYSDHTLGTAVALAAAALGASVIEKHFTLDRRLPGPDHKASLEPHELTTLVADIRTISKSLGDGRKRRQPSEEDTANVARKSVVAACNIAVGVRIEREHLAIKRPGTGLPPASLQCVVGRRAARPLGADTVIQWSDLE